MKPSPLLQKSLGHLAARFSRMVLRRLNAALTREGIPITGEQYSFLIQLWEQNGLPQGVIAEKTAKDKTTMARLAASLEERNLVVRVPSSEDARERLVFLTQNGKEVMETASAVARKILAEAQEGIDEAKVETCREVLSIGIENLLKNESCN